MTEGIEPKKPKKKGRPFSDTCFRGHGWTTLSTVWYTRTINGKVKKFRTCRLCENIRHKERYRTDPVYKAKKQKRARERHETVTHINADLDRILTEAGFAGAFKCAEVDSSTGGDHGAPERPPQRPAIASAGGEDSGATARVNNVP